MVQFLRYYRRRWFFGINGEDREPREHRLDLDEEAKLLDLIIDGVEIRGVRYPVTLLGGRFEFELRGDAASPIAHITIWFPPEAFSEGR